MQTKLLSHLPIPPWFLKYGWTNHREFLTYRQYIFHILAGQTNLMTLMKEYSDSYSKARTKTVLHYRDYLVTQVIYHSLQSVMYTDTSQSELTPHVDKALSELEMKKYWPYLMKDYTDNVDFTYAGHLGTFAFNFLYSNLKGHPVEMFSRLVEVFWNFQGYRTADSPQTRLQGIKNILRLDSSFDNSALTAFRDLLSVTDPEDSRYAAKLYARRNGVELQDASSLSLRVLFGNYPEELLTILIAAFGDDQVRIETLRKAAKGVLSIAKPLGVRMLFQALVIEGLVKAAQVLNTLPPNILFTDLQIFLKEYSQYAELKYNVAKALALSYDGFKALQIANYVYSAEENANNMLRLLLPWLESSGSEVIGKTESGRLGEVINGEFGSIGDIKVDMIPRIGDLRYQALSNISTVGSESIVLKARSYIGDSIVFDVTRFTGGSILRDRVVRTAGKDGEPAEIFYETNNTGVKLLEVLP